MTVAAQVEPSVRVENLVKRFGSFTAVDGISISTAPGEVFGFLGPNGAGKSTTIRVLCGLLRPSAGRAEVAGFDVATDAESVRQNIGYMSQKFSLYDDLRVVENLNFYGGLYNVPLDILDERIAWALDMAGLKGREDSLTGTLPTGWKQRLALGCAVLHRPRILFLDEPTSGVDPISRRQFWDLIHDMAEDGVTVFVTTHYMDEAEYCNRLALLYRGRIVAMGAPSELKEKHMTGELILAEAHPLEDAFIALETHPDVLDVAVFGNALHLVVDDAESALPTIREHLRKQRLEVGRLEPIQPSLEDVFVSLTTGHGNGSDTEGA